jgi:putative FmdB family regulatory protein
MPRYEYECIACGDIVTINTTSYDITEHYKKYCECGGKYKIRMNAPSFHFKGGGWAEDGYSKTG